MSSKQYYRLFMIIGAITLAAILGSFIGVYALFWAYDRLGFWLYIYLGIAFLVVILILYLSDLRQKKQKDKFPEPEIAD